TPPSEVTTPEPVAQEHPETTPPSEVTTPEPVAQEHPETTPPSEVTTPEPVAQEHPETTPPSEVTTPEPVAQEHPETTPPSEVTTPEPVAQEHPETTPPSEVTTPEPVAQEHPETTPPSEVTTPEPVAQEHPETTPPSEVTTPEPVAQEHPETTPPSEVTTPEPVAQEHPETTPPSIPATHQMQQVEAAVMMPDPWFDDPDAGLLSPRNANTQDPSIKAPGQLSDFYQILITNENYEEGSLMGAAIPNVKDPETTDTISALNELFVNVDGHESISEEPSFDTKTSTVTLANTEGLGIPVETSTKSEEDSSSDKYILASPEENLLDQDEASATAAPDISLEEAQLRQLEQDLVEFDQGLNFQTETNLEEQPTVENSLSSSAVSPQADAQLELTAIEALLAEAEKKKEPTIEEKQESSSSVSISSSSSSSRDSRESVDVLDSAWYLGIDLGTTGISAALLNRSTIELYPLYWLPQNQPDADPRKHSFRLPGEVYLPTASITSSETENKEITLQTVPASVAEEEKRSVPPTHNLFSAQLKPYLQIALPYKDKQQKWEPVLQLNEFSTVPLVWVVRSLSKLLLTLKSDSTSTTLGLTAAAAGLNQQNFRRIINNLAGVICTCPSNWSEQYRFNVREALLISKLVKHSQQVFFIEEAIASLLCEIDGAGGETVELKTAQGSRLAKTTTNPLVGNTLVINIGAASTEMTLVDLPEDLEDLTHSDFMLHGFGYGGKGIEQDIICQLLFPQKWRQSRTETQSDSISSTSNPTYWKPSVPGLDQMHVSDFVWEELNLPRPGEPDISDRIGLQQKLDGSLLGKAMLEAAIALKLILQHQDSFTLELADGQWTLQRRDLESQVFVPFVRRLNRELNRLLVAKGIPTEAINQAILTGGVASIGAINRWLRQKLPNAKIIQDSYLDENGSPACSRVAYGLALLPLHPQVLEVPRQQYTDYFLFTELLKVLPERALSFDEVLQLFENRGINTRSCQQRLLAFLEGELPPGLIPSSLDSHWLSQSTKENLEYQAITSTPLFEKQGNVSYLPKSQQLQLLGHHLEAIKLGTEQSLEEPYTVNFALGVVH
ncbi:MAG: hypothetical protein KME33_20675, partial [Aetokthonos hydrillicola CCALA 1050]|nr:hypothetical protein [Aetokthonos hydrillicola CCALA 1050]